MFWFRITLALACPGACLLLGACEGGERAPDASDRPREGATLIPGAMELVERARSVELVGPRGRTVLERGESGDRWRVPTLDGYAADWDAVRLATRGVADLRVVEARTTRPDRHAMLGLLDPREAGEGPGAPGEHGMLVRWLDDEGEELASVILGDFEGESGLRRAARLAGRDEAWLVEGYTPVRTSAIEQVRAQLTLLPRGRVGTVAIERPGDGLAIDARRAHWQEPLRAVATSPHGRLREASGEALESGLAYVPFLEVRTLDRAPVGGEPELTARYGLFEGATVTLRLYPGERAGDRWATIGVEASDTIGGDDFPNPEGVREWLERRGEQWHGWAFRVPAEMLGVFLAERGELLEDAE
ncbi:MAG: hypothetical protein EA378_10415 [Phycisphaerales bacterium]|nr:MAG: hypothetical protein EA378_10415 [Phycisphaerales bacterium]